jgi:23S rRNA (adenine2503-C2)-methyltransferase
LIEVLKGYDFCRRTPRDPNAPKQRRLTFEYIVFGGLNDSKRHADALLTLLRDLDCRVNLIRFHTIPDTPFRNADEKTMLWMRDYLTEHGLTTTIRASRGQDIFAACGLLSTKKQQEEKSQNTTSEN